MDFVNYYEGRWCKMVRVAQVTTYLAKQSRSQSQSDRQCSQGADECLDGYCACFNGNWLCSEDCVCKGCRNIESNGKEVLMLYKEFVKRKSGSYNKFPLEPIPKRKLGAGALANGNLCHCMVYGHVAA